MIAVLLANVPEALAGTAQMRAAGREPAAILWTWGCVAAASGVAALAGYGLLADASHGTIAFVNAFAAGAVITMLVDTMAPEAVEHGGPATGLLATLGFAVGFAVVAAA